MKSTAKKAESSHDWITPEVERITGMSKDGIIASGLTKKQYDEVNATKPARDAERGLELLKQRKKLLGSYRKEGEKCGWFIGTGTDYEDLLDCLAFDPVDPDDPDGRIEWEQILDLDCIDNIHEVVGVRYIAVDEEGYVVDERFLAWFEGWQKGIRDAYEDAQDCMRLAQSQPLGIVKSA